jgi:signal transduction histidine kinase
MSQAFFNIIQNALLSRETGLELKVASRVEGGEIVIEIIDNGCGIPAEQLSRLFEPFFTTRDVGSGTGMGLTVAREIIRSAGGSIEIVSAERNGTTAAIRLPLAAGKR